MHRLFQFVKCLLKYMCCFLPFISNSIFPYAPLRTTNANEKAHSHPISSFPSVFRLQLRCYRLLSRFWAQKGRSSEKTLQCCALALSYESIIDFFSFVRPHHHLNPGVSYPKIILDNPHIIPNKMTVMPTQKA